MEDLGEIGFIGGPQGISFMKGMGDEADSKSGNDHIGSASGDASKKTSNNEKYYRHKSFQIQELENYFKKNPHPDEKGRLELGKRLGLESRQVKFWFQNRRTQLKTQLERHENINLKQENEKLCHENILLCEAMRNPICKSCGSPAVLREVPPEHLHLLIENARLKDELERLGIVVSKFLNGTDGSMSTFGPYSALDLDAGRNGFSGMNTRDLMLPLGLELGTRVSYSFSPLPSSVAALGMTSMIAPSDKSMLLDLGMAAMEELMKLSQPDGPLWLKRLDENIEFLNLDEYAKTFMPCISMKPKHFTTEATRATGTAFISSLALVEALMNVGQWMEMFPRNIGRASFDVICSGMPGNWDGSLHLIQAEFQVLSPLVPTRVAKFVRFCKQHGEGMWVIVDVSVDDLIHGQQGNCRRLPSGCVVQDLPNGYSKVIWIEHTEYNESTVHHLFQPFIQSGKALGAQKWLLDFQMQCELPFAILNSRGDQPELPPSGKTNIVRLAQRMIRSFCSGICGTIHNWETVRNSDDTTLMIRKSIGENGEPPGVILSAATTVRVPIPPTRLLDFLQNEKTRAHWDALSENGLMQQIVQIFKGQGQDNCNSITLLQTKVPSLNASPSNVLVLQETCTDISGSLFVNAPIDGTAMNVVMNGGDPSGIPILPSGFAIIPDCLAVSAGQDGSLLTLAFQILANSQPGAKLTMESIETVRSLIARRLHGIKTGLGIAGN